MFGIYVVDSYNKETKIVVENTMKIRKVKEIIKILLSIDEEIELVNSK